jgi:hypothetical protein
VDRLNLRDRGLRLALNRRRLRLYGVRQCSFGLRGNRGEFLNRFPDALGCDLAARELRDGANALNAIPDRNQAIGRPTAES